MNMVSTRLSPRRQAETGLYESLGEGRVVGMDSEESVSVRVERYRRLAAELRATIEDWEDAESRDALLRVAEAYEQMAAMLANGPSGPGHFRP